MSSLPLETTDRVVLATRSVSKTFGTVAALSSVDITVHAGTVHALIGENGAGKSTLASILAGGLIPDAGTVLVDGVEVSFGGRSDARAAGIGMVPQHLSLVGGLSLLDNFLLGQPQRLLRRARARTALAAALAEAGLRVNMDALTSTLSLPQRQLGEIAIALADGARILLLDEPTSALAPTEVGGLFDRLRVLVAAGTAIVLITHRLDEVQQVADEVTVLAHGHRVQGGSAIGLSATQIARMMVGELEDPPPRTARTPGAVWLSASAVSVRCGYDANLDGVSLQVHAGEIVGLAGVSGSGQTVLLETLAGFHKPTTGTVTVGESVVSGNPRAALLAGVAWIPGDRSQALVPTMTVVDNVDIASAARGLPRRDRRGDAADRAARITATYDVRPPLVSLPVLGLSGGNRQKLLVGRELDPSSARGAPTVVIAEGITQGLDLRASAAIRAHLVSAAEHGAAVVVASADLDELLAISDRIVVMVGGRIADSIPIADATGDRLARALTGLADSCTPAAPSPERTTP